MVVRVAWMHAKKMEISTWVYTEWAKAWLMCLCRAANKLSQRLV